MRSGTKSTDEIMSLRNDRHILLCKLLLIIGAGFLLIFGLLSVTSQQYLLSTILLGCATVSSAALYLLYRDRNVKLSVKVINIVCMVLALSLLITGGRENTGVLWIYPLLAINIFINRFWPAVFLYGGLLIVCSLLLLTPLSALLLANYTLTEALRIEVTLIALYLICLATLHSEERAHIMLIELHDADMHKMAFFDSLTGLPNRWNFKSRLDVLLNKDKSKPVSLLYIDLDNFKKVNDNYGHDVGDKLLIKFSDQLRQLADEFSPSCQIELARMAGDEFVAVVSDPARSQEVAERILKVFEAGLQVEGISHSVFASVGIAEYPEDALVGADLIHRADLAMYQAKGNGRNRLEYYSDKLAEAMRNQEQIESGLRSALRSDELSLVYMPIYNAKTLEVVGLETLLRAENTQLKGIGPDQFIPIAEKSSLIKEVDLWVIDHAFARLVELQKQASFTGKLCINVSGVELHNDLFPAQVKALIDKHGVTPSSIEFEITETAFVLNDEKSRETMSALRDMGISLALDDFGTGFSAFSQLISYPADCLKIDRSFVNDLFSATRARHKMVNIIGQLADLYELRIIAEGVETQEQLEYLQEMGCDCVQGDYLSKPLEWKATLNLLEQREPVAKL